MGTPETRTALVVGAGSIGGPAALTLAAGGAARLLLADDAPVSEADLAAQPALREGDLGAPRARATARTLARLFPGVAVEVAAAPDDGAAAALVARADVVVDATNRFSTAFALNDAALVRGAPLARAGVVALTAQLVSVVPGATGCLRCLFEGPPLPPAAAPRVLGPLAAFAGALLGAEALRLLAGRPGLHAGLVLGYEARSGRARTVALRRRAGCPACAALAPGARPGEAA
jgi:molybdopterin/thiamine biosynthesis adenylyltransferase